MKIFLKFLIIVIIFSTSCEKEKEVEVKPKYGSLRGKIVNEFDQIIVDASVELDSKTVATYLNGIYIFDNVLPGNYKVTASKDAFITKSKDIDIIENEISILDFTLISGESFMDISDSILTITSSNKNLNVKVFSNASWLVNENSDWLEVSSQSGEGNQEIIISCLENSSNNLRVDTIVFSSGEIVRLLVIKQDLPLKLIKIEGLIGNGETEVKDSVYLLFNKPIQVESIRSNWDLCISEIIYKLVNGNKGILFTYTCADLGGRYPFTIHVKDTMGQSINKEIEVPFYNQRLSLEGRVTSYKTIESENKGWISTRSPDRLIAFTLDSMQIQQTINLDFHPLDFIINPHNNLLYVLSGYHYSYIYDNKIYVYNQTNGALVKEIVFEPEDDDHPQKPAIYPYSIGFTKSGYGAVLLKASGSTILSWKIIDSSQDDTTYRHKDYGWNQYHYFKKVHVDYRHSKLLLTEMYGSCTICILDEETHEIEELIPSSCTRGDFITPNRKNSNIYVGQLYDQFIIDLDGTLSETSYLTNKYDGSADFSYKSGEDGLIYFCDRDYFRLMDYNNASTLMWCDATYGLTDFTSSIDGKYAYAYKDYYPDSYFYKFDTDYFYRHIND